MTELRQKINNIVEEKNTKVVPENIRAGRTMFDVEGTFSSDANATAEDIVKGKTAYVNGEKIEGDYEPLDTSDADATAADIMKDKTAYVNGVKVVGTYEEAGGEGNDYNMMLSPKDSGLTGFDIKTSIIKIGDLDLTGIKSMSSALSNCYYLSEIKNILNSSEVTTTSNMFNYCQKLTSVPLFDVANVTNMSYMFTYCFALKSIPQFNTSKVTDMSCMFDACNKLSSVPLLDTSNVTSMRRMFTSCSRLRTIPQFNTSKVTDVSAMLSGCSYLISVPELNASKINNINSMLSNSTRLTDLGGLLNLGKNYTQKTANYNNYMLNLSTCTALTHDSLINVINGLYDLNLTYDVANGGTLYTQTLNLGSTNKAKLTAEEIAIATAKGWTVS